MFQRRMEHPVHQRLRSLRVKKSKDCSYVALFIIATAFWKDFCQVFLTPWMHQHAAGFIAFDAAYIVFLEGHKGSDRSFYAECIWCRSFEELKRLLCILNPD